jgi:C4-dicarboxylate transporter, DctQ subunit
MLYNVDNFFAACEKGLVVILFSTLVGLIVFNIITRNIFHSSFQNALEITPAFVLWLALLGSTLALKQQRHIRLELLLRVCSPGTKRVAVVLTSGFGLGVMGVLFFSSLAFVKNEVAIFGGVGWLSVIFPIFFALSSFRYLTHMIRPPTTDKTPTR